MTASGDGASAEAMMLNVATVGVVLPLVFLCQEEIRAELPDSTEGTAKDGASEDSKLSDALNSELGRQNLRT